MTVIATEGQNARLSALVKNSDTPEYVAFHNKLVVAYEAGTPTYTLGTVLGAFIASPTGTAAAVAGNTGTGTMSAVTVTATNGLMLGVYKLTITKAAANAGDFIVTNPKGYVVGAGTVAVAFSQAGLAFTLSDATDFVVGDAFTITVAGTVKYKAAVATATDGSAVAAALYIGNSQGAVRDTVMVATTDTNVLVLNRGKVIVALSALALDASYSTAALKLAVYDTLADLGILVETAK